MSRNLEVKARIRSVDEASRVATTLGARRVGTLSQKDTFLISRDRRLKLREETGKTPELIYYNRPSRRSRAGRWSSYLRVPVQDGRWVIADAQWSPDERVVVRKERLLFMFGNTRIHLDRVRQLGSFIEFEVPVQGGQGNARGVLRHLVEAFGIRRDDIVPGAYADLLLDRLQP